MIDTQQWSGRRVLVTGAGGFIGSHLTERLARMGADVRALVHYNALGSRGWLDGSDVDDQLDVVAGDITDADCVRTLMKDIEVVFHLAALIGIPYSYAAPASYVRTNVIGTLNVLQAAREMETPRILHTSTSEVYGTALRAPIDEDHPLQGQSPYSASKIGADKMAESFHRSFGVPVVTVRPFNTFGPRQSARAVIPTVISQCLAGCDVIHLGNPNPTRDMNFVENTVDGYLSAAVADAAIGRAINFGFGKEIGIGDLAETISRLTERNIPVETEERRMRPDKSEVNRLLADNTLARELVGWTPKIGLEEGLTRTIDWMRDHLGRYRTDVYSV